eukprot:m.49790 g.49790  ORF g.49790 m.49790 type:complete len:84 (+) comp13368_c0_seq7:116-367(+)
MSKALVPLVDFHSDMECRAFTCGCHAGDNKTEDTAALQKAIDTCDHVVFTAPGIYLSKPLQLHSDFIFEIEGGTALLISHHLI